MSGVLFDPTSAQRIAKAVKLVEQQPPPATAGRRGAFDRGQPFWAKLSTEDGSHAGHYQWKMQLRANGAFAAPSSTVEGVTQDTVYYSAREANTTPGLNGAYVLLTFDGFDSANSNSPLYIFNGTGHAFGKLATAWTPGSNTVSLTPCDASGTVASPAPANITVSIYGATAPSGGGSGTTAAGDSGSIVPISFDAPVGTVLTYLGENGGYVLVSPPILTAPSSAAAGMGLFLSGSAGAWLLRPNYVTLAP